MFGFTALLLVGMVAQPSAGKFLIPRCNFINVISPMLNFNADAFFNGRWYVTHMYGVEDMNLPRLPMCISVHQSINGSQVLQIISSFSPIYDQTETSEAYSFLPNKTVGKYKTETELSPPGELPGKVIELTFEEIVIDTDYNNYVILYYCIQNFTDFFVVMSRKPGARKIHPKVKVVLKKLNVNIYFSASTLHMKCPTY